MNEAKMVFGAAATTAISLTATVSNTYVVGGQTEVDNSTELYPWATATLHIPDTLGASPTGPVRLYMVRGDTDGTSDDSAFGYVAKVNADAVTSVFGAEYVGSFKMTDEAYRATITIPLLGVKKARFYIQNATGTTLVYSATAITVKILPFSLVPAA